ncbi:hypothetical protein RB195_005074 [Necator americanus]|uniref:Uncharacterized protein n=1 Tax=Necator americanus TaxID=51031 RepID=A0ABR1BMN0_NECAM
MQYSNMAKACHILQKGAVVQHIAKAHNLKAERTSDKGERLVDLCEQTGLIIAPTFTINHRRHQLTWQGSILLTPEQQPKLKMRALKLQLESERQKCRTKFRQRVSIHVGVRTRKKLSDADSFTKCIQYAARETLPVLLPQKKFAFASAETKSMYNSVCVARTIDDFSYEKRIRKKLRRQLQQDGDNEWTSRAMEFEKTWEDKKPRKAHALVKQYSSKSKRYSSANEVTVGSNTANGVAVSEATLPVWREKMRLAQEN